MDRGSGWISDAHVGMIGKPVRQLYFCFSNNRASLSGVEWKYGTITSRIIAAAMEVHRELGCGFPEHVYGRALILEFPIHSLSAVTEYEMPIFYKGKQIAYRRVDFFIENIIPTEIKAVSNLEDSHLAQGLNYLEAFKLEIGLLINFGSPSLQFKRLINKKHKQTNFPLSG